MTSDNKNENPAFSNSSDLKSVFEKLGFRDALVWTESLTVKIKLRFHVFMLPWKLSHRVTTKGWGGEGEGEEGNMDCWKPCHTYIRGMNQNFEVELS